MTRQRCSAQIGATAGTFLLTYSLTLSLTAFAAQRPSLFRGVVVADHPVGVRVVSVDASSQAYRADLRPEDIIVSVDHHEVHSIDDFAVLSNALKGRTVQVIVQVFRNGAPRELPLHLYSYPILRTWGVAVVPNHDIRFAEPRVGLDYWTRLGRGFETANKPAEALDAYLNGLHNVPDDLPTAMKAATLSTRIGQQRLRERSLAAGITALRQGVTMMEKLFDYPLTDDQLVLIKRQLEETVEALRAWRND